MSKELLQRIKEEYAKDDGWRGASRYYKFKDWDEFFDKIYTDGKPGLLDGHFDEIATRYADAVTAEMKANLLELRSKLKEIDKSNDDQNAEYVFSDSKTITDVLDQTKHYENM